MSLKNSQTIEDLKQEYIYGSVHKDGRRSFKFLDNLTQTIIACSRNLPEIAESDEDDNEGFRRAMEMLDQIADFKRGNPGFDFK